MEDGIIKEQVFILKGANNHTFGVRSYYSTQKNLKGIVQVIPGMAEHSGRYRDFARFMADNGYRVFIGDHAGCGLTAGSVDKLGLLPASFGWEFMLENIRTLYTYIRKEIPDAPVYIFGHSMGSILARHFLAVYPVYVKGLILSGTFETPNALLKPLSFFTSLQVLIHGSYRKPRWFNKLFYGNLNRRFRKSGNTRFEWISSIREEVDTYVNDPYCGFDCSWGFYKALFMGISAMKLAQHNLKYRKTLPLLNICGQDDPVGNFGKDALKIHRHFFRQRFQNITMKVFKGRHEVLHDESREKALYYLLNWMDTSLQSR